MARKLHEAHSPARTDTDCLDTYDLAFTETAKKVGAKNPRHRSRLRRRTKDTRLLELLQKSGKELSYTPSDVSAAMTLVAQKTAAAILSDKKITPFVCDLATADDLSAQLAQSPKPKAQRLASLITFFGMIPNF